MGACLFHCCGAGFLENRIPTPDDPQGECFFSADGKLITGACGGSPNQYDSDENWLSHTFSDSGGIWKRGGPGLWESFKHQLPD